ncbi:MAG: DNA primase [Planctomycetes bacterium]|nr:DNA primase [Planctomycetota bacterium]
MSVLVQLEVAERVCAAPGSADWGPLSVRLQDAYEVRLGREVAAGLFWPRPQVASAVAHLTLRPGPTRRPSASGGRGSPSWWGAVPAPPPGPGPRARGAGRGARGGPRGPGGARARPRPARRDPRPREPAPPRRARGLEPAREKWLIVPSLDASAVAPPGVCYLLVQARERAGRRLGGAFRGHQAPRPTTRGPRQAAPPFVPDDVRSHADDEPRRGGPVLRACSSAAFVAVRTFPSVAMRSLRTLRIELPPPQLVARSARGGPSVVPALSQDLRRAIEEIKLRAPVEDVVREYVPDLKKRGRLWEACCPFHSEKTPSFKVDPTRGTWHCFGACSEGGDQIAFVERVTGLAFWEALEILADRTGVELPRRGKRGDDERREDPTYEVLRRVARFYQECLQSPEGARARAYLAERGLAGDTLGAFGVGYAPASSQAVVDLARRERLPWELLAGAGLARKNDRGRAYDFFRGRLMIPIRDVEGRTVGFGARRLDDAEGGPKYINTAETELFKKGRLIYGLDLALREARREKHLILVEGYTDVMAAHQVGLTRVGAVLGTSTTDDHARLVRRSGAQRVSLVFDGDDAGRQAARRALAGLLPLELELEVVTLPQGQDPCDLLVNAGAEAFLAQVAARPRLVRARARRPGRPVGRAPLAGGRRAARAAHQAHARRAPALAARAARRAPRAAGRGPARPVADEPGRPPQRARAGARGPRRGARARGAAARAGAAARRPARAPGLRRSGRRAARRQQPGPARETLRDALSGSAPRAPAAPRSRDVRGRRGRDRRRHRADRAGRAPARAGRSPSW